jgi:sec-independent protein translocase protein TatC
MLSRQKGNRCPLLPSNGSLEFPTNGGVEGNFAELFDGEPRFDEAMERSADLWTVLAERFPERASYAVSLAYRIRYVMQFNAREAMHLIELRTRLVRALIGLGLMFLGLFHWSGDIYHLLAKPLMQVLPAGAHMIATDVTTPFFVPMKVTMMVAFVLALPNTLYQIWAFVAPGLYAHEKRLIVPLIISSVLLFITGMTFAYFLVFPVVFGFMSAVTPEGVSMMTDIDNYLSFVLGMFIAFGITFEVPVVVILLVRFGIVDIAKLKEAIDAFNRRHSEWMLEA